jgi:Rieske Fe-S protein
MTRPSTGGTNPPGGHEPVWRRDFPYTSAGEEAVTRREFARYLVLASGTFAAGTAGIAAWASARSPAPDLRSAPIIEADSVEVGASHLFRYPTANDPAILIRLPDSEFVAFSQKCTHLGCVVYPSHDKLECPCHEGFFDLRTGDVLAGPPERPLDRIAVEVRDDGQVWALGYIRDVQS